MTVDQIESPSTTETGGDAEAKRKRAEETLAKRRATIAAKAASKDAAPAAPTAQDDADAVEEALDGAPGTDAAEHEARRLALQDEADAAAAQARQEALDAGVPEETLQAIQDGVDEAVARFDPDATRSSGDPDDDDDDGDDDSPEAVAKRLDIDVPPGYRPVHDGNGGLRFEARDPRYQVSTPSEDEEPGAEAAAILAAAREGSPAPQAQGRSWMPEGQELHPGNVEPEAIVSVPAPVHSTISEVTRLDDFLRANFPQEFSNDHNYVHGQTPVDVAVRLITRLSAVARPEAVQRCPEAFCNKPAGHFPSTVHGWVEAGVR